MNDFPPPGCFVAPPNLNPLRDSVRRVKNLKRQLDLVRVEGRAEMNSQQWADRSAHLSESLTGIPTSQALLDRGYVQAKVLSFGYAIGILPVIYGGGMLCCGCDRHGHDVVYQYTTIEDAIRAMIRMTDILTDEPMCREPAGWVRCVSNVATRYRVNCDPKLEYVKDRV